MITRMLVDPTEAGAVVRVYEDGRSAPTTYELSRRGSDGWTVDCVTSIDGRRIERPKPIPKWVRREMLEALRSL